MPSSSRIVVLFCLFSLQIIKTVSSQSTTEATNNEGAIREVKSLSEEKDCPMCNLSEVSKAWNYFFSVNCNDLSFAWILMKHRSLWQYSKHFILAFFKKKIKIMEIWLKPMWIISVCKLTKLSRSYDFALLCFSTCFQLSLSLSLCSNFCR